MAKANSSPKRESAHWTRWIVGSLLAAWGVLHSVLPTRFAVDWPTVTVVSIAIVVMMWPMLSESLPKIKRVAIAGAEIEMREETEVLRTKVESAEAGTDPSARRSSYDELESLYSVQSKVLELAARNKGAAVLFLASEIERRLHKKALNTNVDKPVHTWRDSVAALVKAEAIPRELPELIAAFWRIRNKVAHGFEETRDGVLSSAISSGLIILRLVWAM